MDILLSICLGLGLAAACGFRVFVPLLAVSVAARTGHLQLASQFSWLGTDAALIALAAATTLEIVGYYVPWVDHFLDTVATPAAAVAGTIVAAAMFTRMDPFLQWTLAIIAGGGISSLVQGGTVLTRLASSAVSGGLANPVVATAELGLSLASVALTLVLPVLAALLFLGIAGIIAFLLWRRFHRNTVAAQPPVS